MSQLSGSSRESIPPRVRNLQQCRTPFGRPARKGRSRVIVGVPKEIYPGERRVALVPVVLPNLAKAGLEVIVESGAGEQAGYPDAAYIEKGAKIVPDRAAVFAQADIVVQVLCYGSNDVTGKSDLPLYRKGQALIG